MNFDTLTALEDRMGKAQKRYGDFTSTHEAMGVAMEEWDEFRDAVRSNDIDLIKAECLDLAACLIRLSENMDTSDALRSRSTK